MNRLVSLTFSIVIISCFSLLNACASSNGSSNNNNNSNNPPNNPVCGNGMCENGENLANCAGDCPQNPVCGNGICETGENSNNCLGDCPPNPVCGNGTCESGENLANCPGDCPPNPVCGNGICETGENSANCLGDCPPNPVCGNEICESGETLANCPGDCPAPRFCTSVAITPASIKIFGGESARFKAICSWSDATASDCTNDPRLAWSFTGPLVQDDFNKNLFTSKPGGGSAQVHAEYNDGANHAVVGAANLDIIAVSPISAGASHTCALTSQKGLKCWGRNNFGQLGDGSIVNRLSPVSVYGLSSGMLSVSGGGAHTCALNASGKVKCWGYNAWGEIGDGTTAERNLPVNVTRLAAEMIAVVAGGHSCALDSSGGLKCWGRNNYGQLGDGTTVERHAPVEVVGLSSGAKSASGGGTNSCAVSSAGAVKCWGYNFNGQLGDGTTADRLAPVDVSGLNSGISAVSVGLAYTCALTDSGGVKCWGYNYLGELGDGTTVSSNVPVDVSGLSSGVSAISAGNGYTCAVTSSGGVKCWGYNYYGELGDGTTANRSVPVDVIGLSSGVIAISAGGAHTCAMTNRGEIKCWGYNKFGQLGDGAIINRKTPVNVIWR